MIRPLQGLSDENNIPDAHQFISPIIDGKTGCCLYSMARRHRGIKLHGIVAGTVLVKSGLGIDNIIRGGRRGLEWILRKFELARSCWTALCCKALQYLYN